MKSLVDRAKEYMDEACWDGYTQVGMKKKGGKMVPNCVPDPKGKIPKQKLQKEEACCDECDEMAEGLEFEDVLIILINHLHISFACI